MESGQRRPNEPVAAPACRPDGIAPPAGAGPGKQDRSRRHGLVVDCLAGLYAAVLVSATHYPRPHDLLGANPPSDKLLHFLAYATLGVLTAASAAARGGWNGPRIGLLAMSLAVFAACDEVTQPLFGRAVEFTDWLADLAGLAVGIGAVVLWTSRPAAPVVLPTGEPPAGQPGESRF